MQSGRAEAPGAGLAGGSGSPGSLRSLGMAVSLSGGCDANAPGMNAPAPGECPGHRAAHWSKPTLSTRRLAALRLRAISATGTVSMVSGPSAVSSGSTGAPAFTGYS